MRYLLRRLLWMGASLAGVSVLIFILVRLLPGNIIDIIAGTEGQLSRAQRLEILRSFGLDRPWPIQYALWAWSMLHGNFGWSFRTSQPVAGLLVSRLPTTVELAALTVASVTLVGLPLGILASITRSPRLKVVVQIVGLLGLSIPSF